MLLKGKLKDVVAIKDPPGYYGITFEYGVVHTDGSGRSNTFDNRYGNGCGFNESITPLDGTLEDKSLCG